MIPFGRGAPAQPTTYGPDPRVGGATDPTMMSDCTSNWFAGLACDHLYDNCPNRQRGIEELRRYGWHLTCGPAIDPHGTDVCGLCLHRHNRTMHKGAL